MQKEFWELVILICSAVGFLWKSWYDTRKISSLVNNRLSGFENSLAKLLADFKEFKDDYLFRKKIRNKIRFQANEMVTYETSLDPKYHSMLLNFSREIEDFALLFYYCDERGKIYAIRDYLEKDISKVISNFETEMRAVNKDPKLYISPNKKEDLIYYDKMILDSGVYSKTFDKNTYTDKLIQRLVENGFKSTEEIIDLFVKYIKDSFSQIIVKTIHFELKLHNVE
jgi:hypothetical protein